MRAPFCILSLIMTLTVASPAKAVFLSVQELVASSSADFVFQGTLYEASEVNTSAFSAAAQALAGNNNTPEARTAARVSADAVAVNARLDGKQFFADTNVQNNSSIITYTATVEKISGVAEHLILHFLLPPSYVETTNNAELQFSALNPAIFADIRSGRCTSLVSCGPTTEHFSFQAYLDSTYRNYTSFYDASGQPGMDLSPLLNPTITDEFSSGSFLRTVQMAFPAYVGTVDLGVMSVGQLIRFTYHMEARALGDAAFSLGIAAINDPFFFDTDPIAPGAPVRIEGLAVSAVPEPQTTALLWGGLAALAAAWRRRSRNSCGIEAPQ